jgi:hypothetical protein
MCVIVFAKDVRPTPEMVAKMYARNSDGAGIAWREADAEGQMLVHWSKGLNLEGIQKLIAEKPLPFVAHFRISSCEHPALRTLTHPFPVEKDAPVWTNGTTGGLVLFHNGHYGDWKKDLKETIKTFGHRIPDGKFNDTRAMAMMTAFYGTNFMEITEEKGILFGPKDEEIFWGRNGWETVNGVYVSNTLWTNSWYDPNDVTGAYSTRNTAMCRAQACIEEANLDRWGYCPKHSDNWGYEFNEDDQLPTVHLPKTPNLTPLPGAEAKRSSSNESPFDHLQRMERCYTAGTIGKRQIKRHRKAYERLLRQATKAAKQRGLMPTTPKVLLKTEIQTTH